MSKDKMFLLVDKVKNCSECDVNCTIRSPYDAQVTHNKYADKRHPQCPLQDTTELIEDLKLLEECAKVASECDINDMDDVRQSYNKLHKALGGKVDERN